MFRRAFTNNGKTCTQRFWKYERKRLLSAIEQAKTEEERQSLIEQLEKLRLKAIDSGHAPLPVELPHSPVQAPVQEHHESTPDELLGLYCFFSYLMEDDPAGLAQTQKTFCEKHKGFHPPEKWQDVDYKKLLSRLFQKEDKPNESVTIDYFRPEPERLS